MKRLFIFILIVALFPSLNGCKDFLNVKPQTALSGNNFWKTQKDVEQFTRGLYHKLRQKLVMGQNSTNNNGNYFIVIGDLRCSPWIRTSKGDGRNYVDYLANNDINTLLETGNYDDIFHFKRISDWQPFYQIIQGCNKLYEEVDDVPDTYFSSKKRKQYKAEAVFLRDISYFFMVRMYGDVPYYTDADHTEALKRTSQITVLQNCLKDLAAISGDLPWTYDDPAKRAVRAMRGSALVLMMHMNMWLAGFDEGNKVAYWEATDSLGAHLLNDNKGAYELLPLEDYKKIFDGRSKEGLFEIPQNLNYGESFGWATFSDMVLHYPEKPRLPRIEKSYIYPDDDFLDMMFPEGEPDKRKDLWFKDMEDQDGKFEYLKFVNVFAQVGEDANPNDNDIVFRLPDAILLRAEALNDLGKDGEARDMLNIVRNRAGAKEAGGDVSGSKLGDMIYWERCRELLGEGGYYYTLVRTKKILSPDYNFSPQPMPASAYKAGAWTWPIDKKARVKNPGIQLNKFWLK